MSSDTGDANGTNDSSTATVTVNRQADLAVTKADSTDPVTVGDEFSYTITVTNIGPSDSGAFTVTDPLPIEVSVVNPGPCTEAPVGTVTCSGSSLAAGASATYTITVSADQAGAPINTASITAAATTDPNTANNSGSAQTTIQPGSFFSDVAAGDPDWQNRIDGVDVMFQKSGTSTYTLKATNPGTFKYRLSLENETGIDIHVKGKQLPNVVRRGVSIKDANGGSTTIYLAVPSMPATTGTPNPLTATQLAEPAFQLTGWRPVSAHPDDRSDDLNIQVAYIPLAAGSIADCSAAGVQGLYVPLPSNSDNLIARCLRVDGLEIPKWHEAHIHVAYEFRWKNSSNWGSASVDPTQVFRAGFNFRSTTVIKLDSAPSDVQARFAQSLNKLPAAVRPDYQARFDALWNKTYTGVHALGLTFAGERMTAVGGFVFDPSGAGRPNITVRLFTTPPSSSVDRCGTYGFGTNGLVASYLTGSDGFYFIWQKNADNTSLSSGTNTLASGFKYYVALCDLTGAPGSGTAMPFAQLYWPARSMSNTLGNKEFDEEDFFVSGPTQLTYTTQPISGKVNKTLGTVKVALLDGFGNVMTMDSGGGASTITIGIASGPVGGSLSSASGPGGLTRSLSQGVATWVDLKLSAPTGVYKLKADSSVTGVPDETSLPINVTN